MKNKDKKQKKNIPAGMYLSMSDLLATKRIFWIESLPTLKKWVLRDIERRNILRTIIVKNNGRGVRYYFTPQYVEDYVNAFHRGELDVGERYEQES